MCVSVINVLLLCMVIMFGGAVGDLPRIQWVLAEVPIPDFLGNGLLADVAHQALTCRTGHFIAAALLHKSRVAAPVHQQHHNTGDCRYKSNARAAPHRAGADLCLKVHYYRDQGTLL